MVRKLLFSIFSVLILGMAGAADRLQAEEGPSLVVYFNKGQSFLSAKDKSKLRTLFSGYVIGSKSRVFILGYTDATGKSDSNYRLSRKRAQTVRREVISSFGIDATIVMAMGRGEENPVADNRKARGRALNRRAEIYLANSPERKPQRVYGPGDPHLESIQSLVRQAEELIMGQRIHEAIRKLDQAGDLGGDHYSDWHAAYGLAGYHAHGPHQETTAHFAAAVRLDPYNFKAREYLSRMHARASVTRGAVTALMGRTEETAIPVTSVAQEYEYLRLFNVEPLRHRELANQPVDVWDCLDADGDAAVYFFNHAGTYAWAFAQQKDSAQVEPVPPSTRPLKTSSQAPARPNPDAFRSTSAVAEAVEPTPSQIWESRVFN